MTITDELLENNKAYVENFGVKGDLPLPPGKHIAILACMDARLNVYGALGLKEGDAHVIRNAGGVVTAGDLSSLVISQRLLGTKEIVLIHHTDCGMITFTDDVFKMLYAKKLDKNLHGLLSHLPVLTMISDKVFNVSRMTT